MNEFENENTSKSSDVSESQREGLYSKKAEEIIQDQPQKSSSPYEVPTYTAYDYFMPTPPKKQKRQPHTHSTAVVIIACVLSALISTIGSVLIMGSVFGFSNSSDTPIIQQDEQTKNNVTISIDKTASSTAEAVAQKCTDSVVGIRTTTSVISFFGGSQEQTGNGSGVVYTSDGYILTNYHVISDATTSQNAKIDVFIGDNNSASYPASVIGYNISCDLAVLKIDAQGLTPVELGDSNELKVGQYVITIGAPGGLEFMGSVTYGIISGLDRVVSTNSTLKLIQTDAAINPGNSGGALLNAEGKLIGINSSKIASVEFEGMGFAIPVNTVKEKCDKIISRKDDSQAYLGVSISSTYTSNVLSFYGYPSGAVVSSVADDSPAYKSGIKRGDIITEFNGVKISEYTVLNDVLYDCEADQTVAVTIYRGGKYYTVNIKLTSETSN